MGRIEAIFGVFLNHPDSIMPTKAHSTDAGFDLSSVEEIELNAGERKLVATGIHLSMDSGWECQIRPRSGNAAKLGLTIVNTPGTVDADYTGEIKVILLNTSKDHVSLPKGAKIAQMVFKEVPHVRLMLISDMPTNDSRGANGMGSTDKKI